MIHISAENAALNRETQPTKRMHILKSSIMIIYMRTLLKLFARFAIVLSISMIRSTQLYYFTKLDAYLFWSFMAD